MAAPFGFVEFEEDAGPEYDYLPEFQPVISPPDSIMAGLEARDAARQQALDTLVAQQEREGQAKQATLGSMLESREEQGRQFMPLAGPVETATPRVFAPPGAPAPIRPPYQWAIDQGGAGMRMETPQELQTILAGPQVMKHAGAVATRPLLPLGKLAVSPQTVEDALDALASASPELTTEEAESVLMRNAEPGTLAKVVSGIQGSVVGGAESMTSPFMLSTLGLSMTPNAVQRAAALGFSVDMLRHAPEASQRLGQAIESGDPREIAAASADLAQLVGFTTLAGKHGLAPERVTMPESIRELAKQPTTGAPNAVQERQAAEVYGNVQEQPGQRAGNVPAEGGIEQVPQRGVPPGDTGGGAPAEEAGRREIPLAEERFQPAEKPEVVKLTTSRLKNPQGDPLGTTYRGTAEDYNRYQAIQKEFKELSTQGKDLGSPEMAAIFKEQETIKNKYGGMPPEPPRPAAEAVKGTETAVFDSKKFTTTNEAGESVADVTKLREAVDSGEVNGGVAANPLLSHLLKPSEAHPLKAIKLLDLSPEELAAITGRGVAYKGRFTLDRATPEGTIEILTRDANGNPLTHADFVQTLNHELTHNAVTSKYDQASPEIKADLQRVFEHAVERAKGTEFEIHNAFTDVHEFLAEAGSSPRIQTLLAQTPVPGAKGPVTLKNSVWGQVLGVIKKVLGLPDKLGGKDTISLLDETMRISAELEGIKRETKGATEERFAREEERKGLPMKPRAGETGAVSLAPAAPIARQVQQFVQDVPGAVRTVSAQLAGKSAPKTSVASEASGNALVRYASSKIAAPLVAKEMATEVLGDHHRDAEFGKRLGAVLVEDRLRGMKDAFTKAGETAKANRVNSLIGQADSPFATEAEYRAALADPEIRAAIDRHKRTVQPTAEAAHKITGGKMAGPGLETGAFVNLDPIFEGRTENLLGGAGRGNLMNPLRRPSKFSKQAAGTAEKYQVDYRTISERMIEGNFEENTKRQMYDQLVKDGLAVMTKPGARMPEIGGKKSVKFVIERKGVPAGGGKARTFVKNLWVREDIAPEVRQALNVDGTIQRAALVQVANLFNRIQLAGPTDAVWHTANMLGSIAGSQGGKNLLIDVARKIPGVNLLDAIGRTTASSIRVLRDAPEIQKQLAELGTIGAGRAEGPPSRLTPINAMHRMITLVDRAGRLVRDDMYKNLVRRGLVKDTEANRREWVNQMGQYNGRLMGQFQRFFKEAGFSPFIVAGRNFNRMAMRRLTLDPGIKAASPAAAAQMRAVEFLGTAAALFVIPSLINYVTVGNPSGRPGTKMGQIDTGKDEDGKHVVIDPAQWNGLRRGLRISGLQAIVEGVRRGETKGKIAKDVINDVLGGVIHPWAGPAVAAATVARTGYSPAGYKESENPKDYGENLRTALEHLNPVLGAYFKGKQKGTGGGREVGMSLGGAFGVKEVPPRTAMNDVGLLYRKWMEKSTDPKVKADYERNQAATFPVTKYKDLDAALAKRDQAGAIKAIAGLKAEGQKNVEILERMRPVVGQGVNIRLKPLFHQSQKHEAAFRNSLTPEERKVYKAAVDERAATFREFLKAWRNRGSTPQAPFGFIPVPTNAPFGFVPSR